MESLRSAAKAALSCDEDDVGRLESLTAQFREALSTALTADSIALDELLNLCQGNEGEAFGDRLGWDTIAVVSSSSASLRNEESARRARALLGRLAETAPPREAFTALLAALQDTLFCARQDVEADMEGKAGIFPQGPSAGGSGVQGAGVQDSTRGEGDSNAPRQGGEEVPSQQQQQQHQQQQRSIGALPPEESQKDLLLLFLLGSLVKALLTVFHRLNRRRYRLFFQNSARLLFCDLPARIALIHMAACSPYPAINHALLASLESAGMAPCQTPAPPTARAAAVHSHGQCGHGKGSTQDGAVTSSEAHKQTDLPGHTPSTAASGCASRHSPSTPRQTPAVSPPEATDDAAPALSVAASALPSTPAGAQGLGVVLNREASSVFLSLVSLVRSAAEVTRVRGLKGSREAVREKGEQLTRELLVFQRLLGMCLLHLLALGLALLGQTTQPLPPDLSGGPEVAGAGAAALMQGRSTEGPSLPVQECLAALEDSGLLWRALLETHWWVDDLGLEAAAVLAGKGGDGGEDVPMEEKEQAEPASGEREGQDEEAARSGEGWKDAVAQLCSWGAAAAVLFSLQQEPLEPAGPLSWWTEGAPMVRLLSLGSTAMSPTWSPLSPISPDTAAAAEQTVFVRAARAMELLLLVTHRLQRIKPERVTLGQSELMLVLEPVVARLRTPPPSALRLFQKACYATLVSLLRSCQGLAARLATVRCLVTTYSQEPVLVSLLCSFCKDEVLSSQKGSDGGAIGLSDGVIHELTGILDCVLMPQNWPRQQQTFPDNAEAIIGGLNLYRFLLLQDIAAKSNASSTWLQKSRKHHAKDLWLLPAYQMARQLEGEMSNQGGFSLPAMVICGICSRCLDLLESHQGT